MFARPVVDAPPYGYGGITAIEWESRRAELSLFMVPDGYPKMVEVVETLTNYAWQTLNLETLWGEVFDTAPQAYHDAIAQWPSVKLPRRTYREGTYVDSTYYTIVRPT